jgi:hypothetical protein
MTDQSDQQSGNPKAPFDPVFPRLVKAGSRGEKLLGFIAYGLYQDAKEEWISDFRVREKRYPSAEELRFYERSWTASRFEALDNAAAQLVAAYTDSVVTQAEKQFLRSALTGSYWRAVLRWTGGALLYTFLLFAIAITLSKSGINLIATLDKIIGLR